MLSLLAVARPRWPHLPLERSHRAGLDILGHIFFENLLTQHSPSHTPILYWYTVIGIGVAWRRWRPTPLPVRSGPVCSAYVLDLLRP